MRIGAFILKESGKYAATLSKFAYVYIHTARKGHIYRLTPSFLLPFRHYCAEEVASSVCNEYGQCTLASDSTIERWKAWWHENRAESRCKGSEIEKDEHLDNTLVDAEGTTLIKFTFNDES